MSQQLLEGSSVDDGSLYMQVFVIVAPLGWVEELVRVGCVGP